MWQKNLPLRKISRIIKKWIIILWLVLIICCGLYFLAHPWFFTVDALKIFLEQFWGALLIVYFFLSALRGFTLIPSLPFVLVGTLLFPDNLYFVFAISLIGILLSSTMVYFFSREIGFEEILLKQYPHAIKRYEKWIHSYWFLTVSIWSFVIIVPTDLICYVAWVLRMNYWKFIFAVALGESIVCSFLIFGGGALLQYI